MDLKVFIKEFMNETGVNINEQVNQRIAERVKPIAERIHAGEGESAVVDLIHAVVNEAYTGSNAFTLTLLNKYHKFLVAALELNEGPGGLH